MKGRDIGQHYILDGQRPVKATLDEWARWFGTADRHVAKTTTELHVISTVFLGLDHNYSDRGPPILFESMVFAREGGESDIDVQWRYASWDDALAGHKALLRQVMDVEKKANEGLAKLPKIRAKAAAEVKAKREAESG